MAWRVRGAEVSISIRSSEYFDPDIYAKRILAMPAARGRHPKPAYLGGARSYYRPERWARERLIHTRRAGAGHGHPTVRCHQHTVWTLGTPSAFQTARGIVTRRAETPLGGSGRPFSRPSRARSLRMRGRAQTLQTRQPVQLPEMTSPPAFQRRSPASLWSAQYQTPGTPLMRSPPNPKAPHRPQSGHECSKGWPGSTRTTPCRRSSGWSTGVSVRGQ